MAQPSILHRFRLKLSDVDRGLYETLELRIARHPSEGDAYLLTRVLAYCLNYQDGIEVTGGICATEEPALWVKDLTGLVLVWIEVGNPSARKLHKAAKVSKSVRVYTYRDPAILVTELSAEVIHRRQELEIFAVPPKALSDLATELARENDWEVLHTEGEVTVTARGRSVFFEVAPLGDGLKA